jgi:uncharacterized protein (DUF1778 family)
MPRTAKRQDRIHLRVSPVAKKRLERAAAYSDKTLTDFIADVALEKADAVIAAREVITLTPEAWEEFRDNLLNPPKLNARMKKALAEADRVFVSDD